MTKTTLLLTLLVLASTACQKATHEETSPAPADDATATDAGSTPGDETATEYVPAYPTDVSDEALSDDDVAQQETTHAHDGGEEHAHGEEDHGHGEDGDHDDHNH